MGAEVFSIEPLGVYDDSKLYIALGVSGQTLFRARKDGSLRFTRKGNKNLYLGEWVLSWLNSSPTHVLNRGGQ